MAGDLRLHELRQIRRRRHPADAGDGRLARRAAGPRDPRVDAVQILHARGSSLPIFFFAVARLPSSQAAANEYLSRHLAIIFYLITCICAHIQIIKWLEIVVLQ